VPEQRLSFIQVLAEDPADGDGRVRLPWLLARLDLASSTSEANRLIKQRAVEVDGEVTQEPRLELRHGMIFRVGKHRFLRLLNTDA
jgi:ribosomal protein S4